MNKTNNKPGGVARARSADMVALARKGGRVVVAKYGAAHMSKIGQCGAKVFKQRYSFKPAGTSGWALVCRADGEVVAFVGSVPGRRRA